MIHFNEGFVNTFINIYNEVKKGTADLEKVENLILAIYNNDELYEPIEENDLMWKRLQQLEKYMNKNGVHYEAKSYSADNQITEYIQSVGRFNRVE
ncbi:hypothetical protein [Bacillus coahuilensis]|uniref:hypothetical protein n=1 Tax=Bacillus coahuilensis TaxID=408580 RepID=UPI00018512FD|nr:hypothetical protein [Bacillus coahuilensis]